MSDAEAKIKVTVLADEAKRAAADLKRDWQDTATTIANAWRGVASAAGSAAQQTLASVGRIATASDLISFDGAIASALEFNATMGKTAIASGRSLDDLRGKFSSIGVKILETPQAVAQAAKALTRHTYDLGKSAAAIEAVGTEGLFTDRSIGEMSGFIKLLSMGADNAAKMTAQLDKLRGTASRLPAKGGSTAVEDWANKNDGVLSKFTGTVSSGARGQIMALRAAMPADLTPEQADEAVNNLVGPMISNPGAYARGIGLKPGSLQDKYGRFNGDVFKALEAQQRRLRGVAGSDKERQRWVAGNVHGPIAGGVLPDLDIGGIRAAMAGASADARIPAMLRDSPELSEARTRAKAAANALATGSGVANATAGSRSWAVDHPWLAGIGSKVAGWGAGLAGSAVTSGLTIAGAKALGMVGAGGGTAAGTTGAGFATLGALGMMGAVGAGGAAGVGIGTAVDQLGNIGAPEGQDWSLSGLFAQRAHEKATGMYETPLTPEVLAGFGIGSPSGQGNSALPTAIGDAVAAAMDRAARGERMAIVIKNYTGGPIEAVEEDAVQSGAQ